MDDILLRPLFKAKYLTEQKSKNKFNQGGLANIQKFNQGGLSKGERTAITLAPFVKALTGARTMPGESQMSSFSRAFGQGLGGLGEAKKTIAAIDQVNKPKDGSKFVVLTEKQRVGEGLPQGTWKKDLTTGDVKNIEKQKLFESTLEKDLAKGLATKILGAQEAGSKAAKNEQTLEIISAVLENPKMTFGAFANLSEGAQRVFEGIGFGNTGVTDITGVEVLRKLSGQKILSDLGQLKGALSEKELKFIQDLNLSQEMTRESALVLVSLFKKANENNITKAKLTNSHIANFGAGGRDNNGKSLDQKLLQFETENIQEALTPDQRAILTGSKRNGSSKSGGSFGRNLVTIETQEELDEIRERRNDPSIQLGDKFEIRKVRVGKVLKEQLFKVK